MDMDIIIVGEGSRLQSASPVALIGEVVQKAEKRRFLENQNLWEEASSALPLRSGFCRLGLRP